MNYSKNDKRQIAIHSDMYLLLIYLTPCITVQCSQISILIIRHIHCRYIF